MMTCSVVKECYPANARDGWWTRLVSSAIPPTAAGGIS